MNGRMNDKRRLVQYGLLDWLSALLAWLSFNVFRFYVFRTTTGFTSLDVFLLDDKAIVQYATVPFVWLSLYYFSGYYVQPRRKTLEGDALNTVVTTLIGVLLLFFAVVVNDYPDSPSLYYEALLGFFLIHALLTWCFRSLLTGALVKRQMLGECQVPVLVIGTGDKAKKLVDELSKHRANKVYKLVGCVRFKALDGEFPSELIVGGLDDLPELIARWQVEELIMAIDSRDEREKHTLLNRLYPFRLPVKAAASEKDIVSGYVTLVSLFGIPMVRLTPAYMPFWQQTVKRFFDKAIALTCLMLLSPVLLYLAWRVKRDTPGPVLFRQERVGKNGKPFFIYKFRTMYTDAEKDGPRLSCENDPRVTPFGRTMRRYRLDELPQFINVLKGDMSLVGPRPERQFFVDQIIARAPHYYLTQSVMPGITSWGMVKFGYADSVDKMIRRLEYDMLYLDNQSLLIDLKILLFTLKPLFTGKGV